MREGIYVREMVEEIYGLKENSVPVHAIVDNKGAVDAIHSTSEVTDKKLRRDIRAVEQMINLQQIKSVRWCPGRQQLADCMTKNGAPAWNLLEKFQTGKQKLEE